MLRVGLLLNSPSPHQVDLLNAIGQRADVDARIGYVFSHNPSRSWGRPTPDLPWTNLPTSRWEILGGQLKKWILSQPVDCWVLASIYSSPLTHYIARVLKRCQRPYVYMGEPPRPRSGIGGRIRHQMLLSILNSSKGIIGTGDEAARRYQSFVKSQIPVTSVPYYIDIADYLSRPLPTPPSSNEPVRFVTSGQLIHRKAIDVLINACRELPDGGWTLEIYGNGPLESELKQQAAATGKPIEFRGVLPYERRHEAFIDRHCFIFPTRWDGWGMVLPEAMALGLPAISTNQAMSAHDFVRDQQNGFIGPAEDSSFLAQSMRYFLEHREAIPAFSKAARMAMTD